MKSNYNAKALALHKKHKGKIELKSKVPVKNKEDLSIAYTPGVAEVCRVIHADKKLAKSLTLKANTVAVISDGSAVLGLGNIGPEAAIPVMEGKAVLFKEFAGVDAFPICLDTQDTEEIIQTIKNIAPVFGGINLEDISAPRCFEIEERLKKELDIPVFHDDQHGTAIVVLAGIINALKFVKKDLSKVNIVINGAGAAALAIAHLLVKAGVHAGDMIILDSIGTIYSGRKDLNVYKEKFAKITNKKKVEGGLREALADADIFIGVSKANVLQNEWVEQMSDKPIVFAMANPDPEISFENAQKTKIAVFGTGRSDYPNQINNVLAFPGLFKGVLEAGIPQITDEIKLKVAYAIASIISKKELRADYVIPKPFDKRVVKKVVGAVKR
ncbi:MAG: Malic enzyme [Candidatus Parcubacteria bacterium]|jgi:malate dehydrogenase (oxaloacetate-decarboxylating)